jgi:hypothetical protein
VVIRATRNTFSDERKACFIRELAAEGFIPEEFHWLPPAAGERSRSVRWLVDRSYFMPGPAFTAQTRRFMIRLLGAAALFWMLLMALLFWRGNG